MEFTRRKRRACDGTLETAPVLHLPLVYPSRLDEEDTIDERLQIGERVLTGRILYCIPDWARRLLHGTHPY